MTTTPLFEFKGTSTLQTTKRTGGNPHRYQEFKSSVDVTVSATDQAAAEQIALAALHTPDNITSSRSVDSTIYKRRIAWKSVTMLPPTPPAPPAHHRPREPDEGEALADCGDEA